MVSGSTEKEITLDRCLEKCFGHSAEEVPAAYEPIPLATRHPGQLMFYRTNEVFLQPSSDCELATLRAAGLEPRKGFPGLFLCRDDLKVPRDINLAGREQELAYAMRDELVARLKEKGTEGLPTSKPMYPPDSLECAALTGVWLQGANLSNAQLQGADLGYALLQGANLEDAKLQGANLQRARLQGADLRGAHWEGAAFEWAQLEGATIATADELATLRAAGLEPRDDVPGLFLCRRNGWPIVPPDPIKLEGRAQNVADLMRTELQVRLQEKGTEGLPRWKDIRGRPRANLMGVWLQGAYLSHVQLQDALLINAQLQNASLWKAQLQKADLGNAQLQGANLEDAQLEKAELREAQLQGANLSNAQLKQAFLSRAQLKEANLSKAQLEKAGLGEAQLEGANLSGAQLKGADFRKAQLEGANLSGAQLEGANLQEAQLEGANLSRVTNMQQASFVRASLVKANLTESKLKGADFTSADLSKANLNGALESMRNYRPPHPPAKLASSSWRSKSVAKSTAEAAYKKLTQASDDEDDDEGADSDSDGSSSEDGDEIDGQAKLAPWLEALENVTTNAAGALVAVAQPVLLVINSTATELGQLCDTLVERVPEALVQSILPLFNNQHALSAAQLQKAVATRLKGLLNTCVLDLIFDKALPDAICALAKQIEHVQRWVKGEVTLHQQAMVNSLQGELRTLTTKLYEQQYVQLQKFAKSWSASAPAAVSTSPTAIREAMPEDSEDSEDFDDQLRDLAGEIIGALTNMLAGDFKKKTLPVLKLQAQTKLDAFAKSAAMPISTVLAIAKSSESVQLATRLPEVKGYIDALKKELCEDALRKRLTKGLLGAANTPLQSIGHGAEQTLALSSRFEHHLTEKLKKMDEVPRKLLRHHFPQGSLRARAIDVVLKTSTKYKVRVGGFEGSLDMLWMAWERSRVELNTDENQLLYLSEKLKKLEDKESTANNWRDAAEGWISVLELRGQLRVQCGQAVLECMAADERVLEALGAAKALIYIEGDTPPAALVIIISQGPGAHIRKHGYRYTRRIDKEVVLIQRVKELQMRALTGVGTLLVATSVAVGNYIARIMYDGVTDGFSSQSWLTWVLPFLVLIGLLVLCCFVLAACLCCKIMKRRGLCGRIAPKGERGAEDAKPMAEAAAEAAEAAVAEAAEATETRVSSA